MLHESASYSVINLTSDQQKSIVKKEYRDVFGEVFTFQERKKYIGMIGHLN